MPQSGLPFDSSSQRPRRQNDVRRTCPAVESTDHEDSLQHQTASWRLPEAVQRLLTPDDILALADACHFLNSGDYQRAWRCARMSTNTADGALMSALMALQHENVEEAHLAFDRLQHRRHELGKCLQRLSLQPCVPLPLTQNLWQEVPINRAGLCITEILLILPELDNDTACAVLGSLCHQDDPVIQLFAVVQLLQRQPSTITLQKALSITDNVRNKSAIDSAHLLYRARILTRLGRWEEAAHLLNKLIRKKSGRPALLLKAIHQTRLDVFRSGLGSARKIRLEQARIRASAPTVPLFSDRLIRLS
jgi:tetratricopeptide (TPR) repeat protein